MGKDYKPLINRLKNKIFTPIVSIKAKRLIPTIAQYLKDSVNILDVGAGDMITTKYFSEHYHKNIIGTDVLNLNLTDLPLVLYDGTKLPFSDNSFDGAYCIFVLHHCNDELAVLKEMVRIAKYRIVIIEEIYNNSFEKVITYINDWWTNKLLESWYINVPLHFHTDIEWKVKFKELGLKLVHEQQVSQFPIYPPTQQVMYVLDKK